MKRYFEFLRIFEVPYSETLGNLNEPCQLVVNSKALIEGVQNIPFPVSYIYFGVLP